MVAAADVREQPVFHLRQHIVDNGFANFRLVDHRQGEAGHSDKGVAPPAAKPWVAGDNLRLAVAFDDELFGSVLEAVEVAVAVAVVAQLTIEYLSDFFRLNRTGADGEIQLLALDGHIDASQFQQILVAFIAPVEFFFILNVVEPVRCMLVVDSFGTLQINGSVFVVQTIFYAILYLFVAGVGLIVFVGQLMDLTEGQQWLELEGSGLEIVEDGVFDDDAFRGVGEKYFFGEIEVADPEMVNRNEVGIEFLQIFVTLWVINSSFVLVHAQVELHIVDDDALVQSGYQHMAFTVNILLGQDEQTVVFTGVEAEQGGGGKGSRAAAADNLLFLREGNIDQFCLVKFYIAHFRINFCKATKNIYSIQ